MSGVILLDRLDQICVGDIVAHVPGENQSYPCRKWITYMLLFSYKGFFTFCFF